MDEGGDMMNSHLIEQIGRLLPILFILSSGFKKYETSISDFSFRLHPHPRFSFFMRVNYWKGISCAMKEAHEFLFSFSFFCIHTKRKGNGAWVNVRVRHKNFRCEEIGRRNSLLHYKENRNAQWIKLAYRFLRRSFFLVHWKLLSAHKLLLSFEMLSWCKKNSMC